MNCLVDSVLCAQLASCLVFGFTSKSVPRRFKPKIRKKKSAFSRGVMPCSSFMCDFLTCHGLWASGPVVSANFRRWRRWMCWSYWRTCLSIRCAARSFRSTAELYILYGKPLPSIAILIVEHVEQFEAVLCPFASFVTEHSKLTWTMSE